MHVKGGNSVLRLKYGRMQQVDECVSKQDYSELIIWSKKVICSPNIKPRLRAQCTVSNEQELIHNCYRGICNDVL